MRALWALALAFPALAACGEAVEREVPELPDSQDPSDGSEVDASADANGGKSVPASSADKSCNSIPKRKSGLSEP